MVITIPNDFRPGGYLKPCELGVDLPSWFVNNIRSMDNKLYPIFHPYSLLYEDFMTADAGNLDDPRYCIHTSAAYGNQELWGWPLKSRAGVKFNENWHLWRLSSIGWCHVFEIESRDSEYLKLMLDELFIVNQITNKYGPRAVMEYRRDKAMMQQERQLAENKQLMNDTFAANRTIMKRVIENFEAGRVDPTNPTVETISSYAGQTNRSRIIRPLDDTDKQSGLVLPPGILD